MITPAPIPSLADGESQKSLSKELEAPMAASKAGQAARSAWVPPAQGTPGQAVCSFPSSLRTAGGCNLSHSYLEKRDLLPDGVEEKKGS